MSSPKPGAFTLLVLLLSFSCSLIAQPITLYTESFETWGGSPACAPNWTCGAIPACTPFGACYWGKNDAFDQLNSPSESGCNNQGFYARCHSSQLFPGEIAYLTGPTLNLENVSPTANLSLSFCYINAAPNLVDLDVDTLRVYLSADGGDSWSLEFLTNQASKSWKTQVINIPSTYRTTAFRLKFTGTGQSGVGDMGIDDLLILETSSACLATPSSISGIVSTVVCKDEISDSVTLAHSALGGEYSFLLTDSQGILLNQIADSSFDLNALPVGSYQVHGVSHSGGLDIPLGGMLTQVSSGTCHLFSTNSLSFEVVELLGQASVLSDYQGYGVSQVGAMDGSVSAQLSGGLGNHQYEWHIQPPQFTAGLENQGAGIYPITITDASGCQWQDTLELTEPDSLLAELIPHQELSGGYHFRCAEDQNGSLEALVNGGVAPYSFDWVGHPNHQEASLTDLGPGTYEVMVQDANGVSLTLDFRLLAPPLLELSQNIQAATCYESADGQIILSAQGGVSPYTYTWTDGFTGINRTNLRAGRFACQLIDALGCSRSVDTTLLEPSPLLVESMIQAPTCAGDADAWAAVEVSGGTAPYRYEWAHGPRVQSLFDLPAGSTYEAIVQDRNGCTAEASVAIPDPSPLEISFLVEEVDGNLLGALEVQVSGGYGPYSFDWENESTDPRIEGLTVGTYSLSITDAGGCVLRDSAQVGRKKALSCLEVHTAFSPNGDGVNETWFIPCINDLPGNEISIINRWGQEIYEVSDYDNSWDGSIGDQRLPAGTYFYAITYEQGGQRRLVKGTVTILR